MLRFGTDGVRGRAYEELLPDDVVRLAQAMVDVVGISDPVVIGRDTRASSRDFADALISGFTTAGVPTLDMGVVPTPAVAWAAARDNLCGAVVSASHNPWTDNGIKLFGPGGQKLGDDVQESLESAMADPRRSWAAHPAPRHRTTDGSALVGAYRDAIGATAHFDSPDLHVVVDAAHGSAVATLPAPLRAHGVNVTVINAEPDGRNINHRCGSTHPDTVARAVEQRGADLGLTFDGDADRVLAVDHTGEVVDGDQIIAICALDRHQHQRLPEDTVVVTVMTNLGFHRAMEQRGINVVTTPVGDRHVSAALQQGRWALGGEQSGHIIFPELAHTGDGMITALQLLEVMARRCAPLRDLAAESMTRMPQVLRNVAVKPEGIDDDRLSAAVTTAQQNLGDHGRILVRPSGTEPVIRIMVEAETAEAAEVAATHVVAALA
ncbi:phosphoglucosamine mutase [Candidatus Poriferisocius sp.]|uniref:phosphoglucosamine mutase n=1 Tax=Candidatus Poriferisocius sp. TaxID=3101276 RepID=UPI003B5CA97A